MRIAVLSDLHLSVQPIPFPAVAADVLVLAGDIARPARAMQWAQATQVPTLYVAGNHEFFGSDLISAPSALRELARGTRIRILERSQWHWRGVRFLGCTLWSDFRLDSSTERRDAGIAQASQLLRDFSHIKLAPDFEDRFTPAASQLLFMQSVAWLEECFAQTHEGPTVVVTHFAPTKLSIHPRFAESPLNACFVSELRENIVRWQPALWIHGHTHDSFDYRVGNTRVVCNPRGYSKDGVDENPAFDVNFVVELQC